MKRGTYLAARASNTVGRFIRAAGLCFILVFQPQKFYEVEKEEIARVNANERGNEERNRQAHVLVRQALWKSAFVVFVAVVLGGLIGLILGDIFGCASAAITNVLQVGGAGFVLWATLFVRGWEIQTYSGETLSERVNQWMFRALSFIGTAVFFCALFWEECA